VRLAASAAASTGSLRASTQGKCSESKESNNTRSATLTVDPLPNSPDVAVKALCWSEDDGQTWHQGPITAGKKVLFEADVTNQGTGPTPNGVAIRVDFRADGTPIAWSDDHTTAVGPGQTVSLRASGGPDGDRYWNDAQAGSYTIRVQVDDDNRIPGESDETNNALDVPVTVQGAATVSATIGSISGAGNILKAEAGSHKIADLVALHCGLARVKAMIRGAGGSGLHRDPYPTVRDRLVKAGVRFGGLLNEALGR
jgi:subtilase family serine protease